jgi:hypothetical protein
MNPGAYDHFQRIDDERLASGRRSAGLLEYTKLAPACQKPGIPEILHRVKEMKLNYIYLKT